MIFIFNTIQTDIIRQKDKEVLEVKAKIAQLYAVMPSVPNDSFINQCSSGGSSLLRLNADAPLQGPSSPLSHAHMSLGGSPLMNQLQNLSVFTSTSSSTSSPQQQSQQSQQQQSNQQQQQNSTSQVSSGVTSDMSQTQSSQNNNLDGSSSLDPNATAYTPNKDV